MKQIRIGFAGMLTVLCLVVYSSCDDDDRPERLPPLTMEGKNTFGCLVNGKVWVAKSKDFNARSVYAQYQSILTIGATSNSASFSFAVFDPITINTEYSFQNTSSARAYYVEKSRSPYCVYEDYHVTKGTIVIRKLDLANNIVCGTFEFTTYNPDCGDTVKVTEGRFDIGNITR